MNESIFPPSVGDYNDIVQFAILGNSGTGKTSILNRFINNEFEESLASTVFNDGLYKLLTIKDRKILVNLWDTTGNEKYNCWTAGLFRKFSGFILVYDITNKLSFDSVRIWADKLEFLADINSVPTLLLGNKLDLQERREVTTIEAQLLAQEMGIPLVECSAKEGVGINDIFLNIITSALRKKVLKSPNSSLKLTSTPATSRNGGRRCMV